MLGRVSAGLWLKGQGFSRATLSGGQIRADRDLNSYGKNFRPPGEVPGSSWGQGW